MSFCNLIIRTMFNKHIRFIDPKTLAISKHFYENENIGIIVRRLFSTIVHKYICQHLNVQNIFSGCAKNVVFLFVSVKPSNLLKVNVH